MSIRQRVLIGATATLIVAGTSVGMYAAQAPNFAAGDVEIVDTAGVLYAPDLRDGLDDLRFYEPTNVAVFTHNGGTEALTNDYALNNAVLEHALRSQPEWLSANRQKWADGLLIFAVDPEGRLVGTYFGEDRAVPESSQLKIQDAAKDDFRHGQWTAGAIAGVAAAADRMNAPTIRQPMGMAAAAAASITTLVGSLTYIVAGVRTTRRSRKAREAGDRAMANVVGDYDKTELHARLIPEQSRYGGAMLERFTEFSAKFRELVELGETVRAIPERKYDTRKALETLTRYQEKASSLDQLDDIFADTATFLNQESTWEAVWNRQVSPLRKDLEAARDMISSTLPDDLRSLPEAQALRVFSTGAQEALDNLRGALEKRTLTPDDALDKLRETRDELSGRLDALAGAVAREYSSDKSEQQTIAKALRRERSHRIAEPTILCTVDPLWIWFAVSAFQVGFRSGTTAVAQARSAASSASSSSSYDSPTFGYTSSSGGSFSGAGSSSRF